MKYSKTDLISFVEKEGKIQIRATHVNESEVNELRKKYGVRLFKGTYTIKLKN